MINTTQCGANRVPVFYRVEKSQSLNAYSQYTGYPGLVVVSLISGRGEYLNTKERTGVTGVTGAHVYERSRCE
jgi:hypothetical protein